MKNDDFKPIFVGFEAIFSGKIKNSTRCIHAYYLGEISSKLDINSPSPGYAVDPKRLGNDLTDINRQFIFLTTSIDLESSQIT